MTLRRRSALLLAAALALAPLSAPAPALAADPTIPVAREDGAMNDAIGGARSTLETEFWPRMEDPRGAENLMLKVAVPVKDPAVGLEHIWVSGAERLGGEALTGRLANNPAHFEGAVGDRLAFRQGQISDWMYNLNGKIHGAYTLRVLLPRIDPAEAAQYAAMLAPLPE